MGIMDMLRGRPSEEEVSAAERQAKIAELEQLRGRRKSIQDNIGHWGSSTADTADLNNINERITRLEQELGTQGTTTPGIEDMRRAVDHADEESRSQEQK